MCAQQDDDDDGTLHARRVTTGQGGHGVSGGHQRCGVGMGGRLAGSICEPHTSARGLVAGRRIRGVQGRQRCACDLGCMWSFGPAPVVLRRAGIMTNRQTRRIWWRRNGRLPACFSASLVLLSNGWRRFSWRCGWLGVPLPRPSPLAPLAVAILRRRGPARSADNAAVSYSYSSPN